MKDNPALPGGSLKSKPTWGASQNVPHVGFFIGPLALRQERSTTSHERSGSLRRDVSPAIIRERRSWTPTEADGPKTEAEKPGTPSTGKCDSPDGWASSGSIAT